MTDFSSLLNAPVIRKPKIRRTRNHLYYIEDDPIPYPSVTTIINATVPKNLSWWGMQVACDGVIELVKAGLPVGSLTAGSQIVELLNEYKLTVNHTLSKSQDRGNRLHKWLEDYAKTGTIGPLEAFPEAERGRVNSLAKWILENDPEFEDQEVMTVSMVHRYAGTYDAKMKVDGKRLLVDMKSGNKIYPDSCFPQCEAYREAEREWFDDVDGCAVLHIPDQGEAKLYPSKCEFEDFRVLLEAFNRMKSRKKK